MNTYSRTKFTHSIELRYLNVFLVETPNILTEAFNVINSKMNNPMILYHIQATIKSFHV